MVAIQRTNEFQKIPVPRDLATRQINISDNARTVLEKRYLRRGEDGKPIETEQEMFWRVAYHVALAEKTLGGDEQQVETWARKFFDLLTNLEFFPNSPTFTGAGTPLGQLAACFTADMRVTTDRGMKPIADIQVGDQVLTHLGRYRPVVHAYKRPYEGKLLRIKVKLIGTPLEVTPEHPILTPNGWVKAGDLKKGDLVAVGLPSGEVPSPRFDLATCIYNEGLEVQIEPESIRVRRPSKYQNSGRQAQWANRFVEVTPGLARLCGYFVAEGTIGSEERYLRFTFSKDEIAYKDDVIELIQTIFNAPINLVDSNYGNWTSINVYNRAVVAWFRDQFGHRAFSKRIPLWLQYASEDIQTEFLIGLLRGDGLYSENVYAPPSSKRPQTFRAFRLTLANPELIQQVWQMCLRLGYEAAIRTVDTTYVTANARETAQIGLSPRLSRDLVYKTFGAVVPEPNNYTPRHVLQADKNQVYFKIEKITEEDFEGTVYNCEVEEDNSYVTEGVIVHNCFVLKIDDDMGRTGSGIFETLQQAALIQQTGGGNGFSFSRLRPKGALVKSSSGQATGPIGFLRVYDQAFGEIAQGGCLTPDTLVFTERGLLRLDEIVTHSEPGWREHQLHVSTDEGERLSTQTYNNGVAPVLRITTHEGVKLTGTPNHKVKVMTATGPAWRRFDELQAGDAILVKLSQHQGQIQALRRPERQHGNQVMPTFSPILDEELAFFLGCLVGDGFVASAEEDHRVGISVAHNSYLIKEMPRLIARLFGEQVNLHRQQKQNDASVTFIIDNRAVKDYLLMNGLAKGKSIQASVPRLIRQSPPNIVGAFLRGLFEADGALSHHYPQLLSSSETLIREVATLLIGLGCPVRIHEQPHGINHYGTAPIWSVRINSYIGLDAWRKNIGCAPGSRFAACHDFEPDLGRETSYVLPHAEFWIQPVLAATLLPQIDQKGRGRGVNFRATAPQLRRQLLRYARGERQLTVSGYARLAEAYPEFIEHAEPVNDLWFVTVRSVENAGESLTLDIEVEENHTYIANGLISHNSRRGANMAVLRVDHPDIREFIKCKSSEGTISNFNISVGITDSFMSAVEEGKPFDLINPQNGEVWETVDARELFNMIVEYAHHNGEPGVLFLDAANRENPVPHLYELESTNPCVTGDTLIYTDQGLVRAKTLFDEETSMEVVTDSRFGYPFKTARASRVFMTGVKQVYRLQTKEGYFVRATADHRIMTSFGWVPLSDLQPGDRIHILNQKGGFGTTGSEELGRVLGWLIGDGNINKIRAVLSFFGEEKRELAPMFAGYVNDLVAPLTMRPRKYNVGFTEIIERDEARVQSERLVAVARQYGLYESKHRVPEAVYTSSEAMQRGFLQALFTADGSVQLKGKGGCSLRLASSYIELLEGVQLLLLNFGVASRIYRNRRIGKHRMMPDGRGGSKLYWTKAQHELVITSRDIIVFADEIGFLTEKKQQKLTGYIAISKGLKKEHFTATIESITEDGIEEVFDLTEPVTNSFISNGIIVHNCGEQFLGPFENCCLGSVNLAQHITDDDRVDWEKLAESVATSTRFLDDVVTANAYVPAIPQLREAAEKVRRIGLGIMGLADMMYALGIRYGSHEGQEFASQIMEFVRYQSMQTSIELAKERTAFLAIEGSRYDPDDLKWTAPKSLVKHDTNWGRPALDWKSIENGIHTYGIRNGAICTIAPTGTISTVSGCEGYGCEPVFALAYMRYVNTNAGNSDERMTLQYTSPQFERALRRANLSQDAIDRIIEQVNKTGSCQDVLDVPENIRRVFVTAGDISAEEHIRMQAVMQAHVDNALSKTINMPSHATEADVATAYMLGWKLGCKGLTVYVTGSRDKVVLETAETREKREGKSEDKPEPKVEPQPLPLFNEKKKPRPGRLTGYTYRIETPAGTTYVTINENGYGEGQPFEVFIQAAKAGSETAAVSEAMGRLLSLILRQTSPVPPRDRVKEMVSQLRGIGAGRQMGFGPNRVASLPDGIAQLLEEYLYDTAEQVGDTDAAAPPRYTGEQMSLLDSPPPLVANGKTHAIGDLCPECGDATLIREEGCLHCYTCGYSEC